jgi:hypothetical protein
MKTLLQTLFLFALAHSIWAAEVFTVVIVQGESKVKGSDELIHVGNKLQKNDQISLEKEAYLGLVHNKTGKLLELDKEGTFQIKELEKELLADGENQTAPTQEYAQNIVLLQQETETALTPMAKGADASGSQRANLSASVVIAFPQKAELLGNETTFSWFLNEEVVKVKENQVQTYVVKVNNLYNEPLFEEEINQNSFNINLQEPKYQGEKNLTVQVMAVVEGKSKLISEINFIKKVEQQKAQKLIKTAEQLGDPNSALGNLIKAQYLEENGMIADAVVAYKKVLALAPKIESYKVLYENFLQRNKLTKEAILNSRS